MNSDSLIINQFFKEHPKDAARALEELKPENLAGFLNDSPPELLLDIIPKMDPHMMVGVYEAMHPEILGQLLESLELHYAVLAFRMMHKNLADKVLEMLSNEKSNSIKRLLHYFENSVGSHMDPSIYTLKEDQSLKEALTEIKKHKKKVQPQLFVLSSERILRGILPLGEILTGSPDLAVKSVMNTKFPALSPEIPIQSVLSHPEWEHYYALPVVDNRSFFLGAINLESIRSVNIQSAYMGEAIGQTTVNALGELYRLGLAGLLRSAADLNMLSEK